MIAAIGANSLLAAAFGAAPARSASLVQPFANARPPQREEEAGKSAYPQPVDTVEIASALPREAAARAAIGLGTSSQTPSNRTANGSRADDPGIDQPALRGDLSDEEQKQVDELRRRDQEVRRHEQAHAASAGGNARGGPSFEFETGPDGKRYAVSGEVSIDTSPVAGNPRATIAKMEQIRRAALAPSEPSSQDRAIAAQAAAAAQKARAELAEEDSQETSGVEEGRGGRGQQSAGPNGPASSTNIASLISLGERVDISA